MRPYCKPKLRQKDRSEGKCRNRGVLSLPSNAVSCRFRCFYIPIRLRFFISPQKKPYFATDLTHETRLSICKTRFFQLLLFAFFRCGRLTRSPFLKFWGDKSERNARPLGEFADVIVPPREIAVAAFVRKQSRFCKIFSEE